MAGWWWHYVALHSKYYQASIFTVPESREGLRASKPLGNLKLAAIPPGGQLVCGQL
jgi:hypothetical protein